MPYGPHSTPKRSKSRNRPSGSFIIHHKDKINMKWYQALLDYAPKAFSVILVFSCLIVVIIHFFVHSLNFEILPLLAFLITFWSGVITAFMTFFVAFRKVTVPPMSALVIERDGEYIRPQATGGTLYLKQRYFLGL